jgi:hypothetical protein
MSTSNFNNIINFITLVCNYNTVNYEGDDQPRVRVTKNDNEQTFLYDTGAQQTYLPFKAFKMIYGPDR